MNVSRITSSLRWLCESISAKKSLVLHQRHQLDATVLIIRDTVSLCNASEYTCRRYRPSHLWVQCVGAGLKRLFALRGPCAGRSGLCPPFKIQIWSPNLENTGCLKQAKNRRILIRVKPFARRVLRTLTSWVFSLNVVHLHPSNGTLAVPVWFGPMRTLRSLSFPTRSLVPYHLRLTSQFSAVQMNSCEYYLVELVPLLTCSFNII